MTTLPLNHEAIEFTRSAVARILDCSVLTVANREKRGVYPPPRRGTNNYRYYTLVDIFELQEISHSATYLKPVLVELYDKGYKDPKTCSDIVDAALMAYNTETKGDQSS